MTYSPFPMDGPPDSLLTTAGEVNSWTERVAQEREAVELRKQELKQRIAFRLARLRAVPVESEALAADNFELAVLEGTDDASAETRQRLYEQHLAPRRAPGGNTR